MSNKFVRKMKQAASFEEWLKRLARFDYSLVRENGLQMWTKADYQSYWEQYRGAIS
jgi:hypothetical protein